MKRNWKRIVAGACAIVLAVSTIIVDGSKTAQANSSMSLKDAGEYLAFGEDDTHLQLSKPLVATPNAIEASVKMEAVKDGEWILRSGHNKGWTWYGLSNNEITYKTTGDADKPGAGLKYAEVPMAVNDQFGFENGDFNVSVPSTYENKDLALEFWFYSSTGISPEGQIRLSSSGGPDTNYVYWNVKNYDDGFKVGWNKITLPFSTNDGIWNLDKAALNYLRWHDTVATTTAATYAISDVKIIDVNLAVPEEQTWTLLKADTTLKNAAQNAHDNTDFAYNQTVSTGTIQTADNAPAELPVGTAYTKIVAHSGTEVTGGVSYVGGRVGFVTPWEGIKAAMPTLPAECQMEDLKLSYWLYSSSGKLPDGGVRITSSGWTNTPNLEWWNGFKIKIQQGWNHIELKLSDANAHNKAGDNGIDYKNMSFLQMYSAGTLLSEETEYRITDIKLVYTPKPKASAAPTVTTTENVDATALIGNQMIFSNTNISSEIPYALFVNNQGYPSLLWETTLYTLTQNVRTGEFVTIKVVKNAAGKIEFYVDGALAGTSDAAETADLGSFQTAHRIGADGNGTQVFKGTLANLSVYSDSAASNCIGSWTLEGDIQHVLKTMEDTSEQENDAVFRGTRASDWISYEEVKAKDIEYVGDDYWSVVFIPDIQKITKYDDTYNEAWMNMATWIGNNVATENIKHVIGAGDSTDDNTAEQWERTVAGYEKFWNKVSWSNMTGNHDYVRGASARDASKYQSYFGASAIQNTAASTTYAGSYSDDKNLSTTENSYYRFEVNGVSWMILQLEYHPRMEVLAWADNILKMYPNDNVILTTHSYLNYNGTGYIGEDETYIHDADGNTNIDSTEEIWNQLKDNSNIKMILCGHQICDNGEIAVKNEVNDAGDIVPAYMINAQTEDRGSDTDPTLAYYSDQPLGLLSILRFSKDGSKMALQYYSPEYDRTFDPLDTSGNRSSNNIQLEMRLEEPAVQYMIYSSETGENIVKDGGEIFYIVNDAGVQVPATGTIDNLILNIRLHLADADAVAAAKNCWVELTNKIPDAKELCWSLADQNLKVGENVVRLKLKDATPYFGNKNWEEYGAFTLDETVNCFRIYGTGNVAENDIKLYEVKLVENKVAAPSVSTENMVPRIFSNGMLFQQNKPMNLWGYGNPGDTVEIFLYKGSELADKKKGTIGTDGRWDLAFDARTGSYDIYSIDIWIGTWNYAFGNVLVGELWVAGGQSNMELTVHTDMNSDEILANANDQFMRMFLYPNGTVMRPVEEERDIKNACGCQRRVWIRGYRFG